MASIQSCAFNAMFKTVPNVKKAAHIVEYKTRKICD